MPGKDGAPATSTSELQSLVRLLHREHGRLYSHWDTYEPLAPHTDLTAGVTGRCSPYDHAASLSMQRPGLSASGVLLVMVAYTAAAATSP